MISFMGQNNCLYYTGFGRSSSTCLEITFPVSLLHSLVSLFCSLLNKWHFVVFYVMFVRLIEIGNMHNFLDGMHAVIATWFCRYFL